MPEPYDIDYSPRCEASIALVRVGSNAVPVVAGLLHSEDEKIRDEVMTALVSYAVEDSSSVGPDLTRSDGIKVLSDIRNGFDNDRFGDVTEALDYWLAHLRGDKGGRSK